MLVELPRRRPAAAAGYYRKRLHVRRKPFLIELAQKGARISLQSKYIIKVTSIRLRKKHSRNITNLRLSLRRLGILLLLLLLHFLLLRGRRILLLLDVFNLSFILSL